MFTRDNEDVYYMRALSAASPGPLTWGPPRNISASAVALRGSKHFVGTGHALGLQLRNGTLLAPLYGGGSNSFVLRSDTHGETWHIGGVLDSPPNEWAFVPVSTAPESEHKLLGSLRSEPSRRQAWSTDAGTSWTPTVAVPGLPEPIKGCEASLLLHPDGSIFYAHPQPTAHLFRNTMNIKISKDQGHTWRQHTQIWGEQAGNCRPPCVPAASYSSMALVGQREEAMDGEVGLFYMRNNISMVVFEGTASYTTFKP